MAGVDCLITELDRRGFHSAAAYLGDGKSEFFTVTGLKEQGTVPELVMVATGVVKKVFREIKRRTEVGERRSDEG